jgi:mRNA interferase MazF
VFPFGSILLAKFPFSDLSGTKRRPVLLVSRDNHRRLEVAVCFITSVPRSGPDMASIAASPGTGLRAASVVRFDKIATLSWSMLAGKLGDAPASWLAANEATFFNVFGFRHAPPATNKRPLKAP